MRLLLAGDVMTGRGIDQVLPHPSDPQLHEGWVRDAREYVRIAEAANGPIPAPVAPAYPWGDALAAIDRAAPDLRIVNLETAITRSDQAWPGKGIHYRMHPANVDCLRAARLDACSLANNHVMDWGREGLAETLATLAHAGLRSAGAGANAAQAHAPAVLERPGGGRVLLSAWAAASSGVPANWGARAMRSGIALLQESGAAAADQIARSLAPWRREGDVVIASLHWGGNWGLALPPEHRALAHRLIDVGAAQVVHGHSSHHPLPVEVYRGHAILYGCGDLLNDYEGIGSHGSLRSDAVCLYLLDLDAASRLERMQIVPLRLRRLRLEHAEEASRGYLRDLFDAARDALGTRVEDPPDGSFALRWK